MLALTWLCLLSASQTPELLLQKVQQRYDALSDYSADFTQTLLFAARPGKSRVEKGVFSLKRPGLMRWDYSEPDIKYWVVDGQRLWFYKPDENQVLVNDKFKDAEVSAGLSFLWSKKDLAKVFIVHHFTGPDPLDAPVPPEAIKLIPKQPDEHMKELVFYLDPSGLIDRAIITDNLGNINVLTLSHAKINKGLPREAFQFVPPDGVKVVHVDLDGEH
jgi:outer membrane lipoprotein carrier protein